MLYNNSLTKFKRKGEIIAEILAQSHEFQYTNEESHHRHHHHHHHNHHHQVPFISNQDDDFERYCCSLTEVKPYAQTLSMEELMMKSKRKRSHKKRKRNNSTSNFNPSTDTPLHLVTEARNAFETVIEAPENRQLSTGLLLNTSSFSNSSDHRDEISHDDERSCCFPMVDSNALIDLSNRNVDISALGPSPRGSITIVSEPLRMVVAVLWSVHESSFRPKHDTSRIRNMEVDWFSINVMPLVGFDSEDVSLLERFEKGLRKALWEGKDCDDKTPSWEMISTFETPSSSSSPEAVMESFVSLSNCIVSIHSEATSLLEQVMGSKQNKPERSHNSLIYSALKKVNISPGQSLDHFDLYKHKLAKTHISTRTTTELNQTQTDNEEYDPNVCLICFDELNTDEDDFYTVRECGHSACRDCWEGYLKSAASSGTSTLGCPAFRCQSRPLGLVDIAHVLSGMDDKETKYGLQCKLTKFHLDQQGRSAGSSESGTTMVRFCPTASCSRLLVSGGSDEGSNDDVPLPGSSLFMCRCGTCLCAGCTTSVGAHPGISCVEFKELRKSIDSGKLDDELESLNWVVKNSRPCPKCHHPIQRNGGCNHMRCQQCDFYFCWQCGGPGLECRSFLCTRTNKLWTEEADDESESHKSLLSLVSSYREYRSSEARIKQLSKMTTQSGDGTNEYDMMMCSLELQLQRTKLWLLGYHVVHKLKVTENGSKDKSKTDPLVRLDLILHAISLRALAISRRDHAEGTSIELDRPFLDDDEICAVMGVESRGKKRNTERPSTSSFESLIADMELLELCKMNHTSLVSSSKKAIKGAVQYMVSMTEKKGRQRCRRKKGTETRSVSGKDESNKSSKGVPPWKLGLIKADGLEEERKKSWKRSKGRVNSRRIHELQFNEDILW